LSENDGANWWQRTKLSFSSFLDFHHYICK
jgi:hypothetical protein